MGGIPGGMTECLPKLERSRAMTKAKLIYCCRGGVSSGHIDRALALAEELSDHFHVTVLLDDSVPRPVTAPVKATLIFLPTPESAERRSLMLNTVAEIAPRVLVIEDFPFYGHQSKEEILPLIQLVRGNAHEESLVVSVTDGVLATDDPDEENRSAIAANVLQRYFDMVVVRSDPVFARLEEFFQPNGAMATPIFHTGFVAPLRHEGRAAANNAGGGILVSAGGGQNGGALFRAAIEAHRILWHTLPLPMTIVTGRQLPADEWQDLMSLAGTTPALTLTRTVPDQRTAVASARLSVSQCGYNSTVNAIAEATPSLFIPHIDSRSREELIRAQRLVYWGAGRLMMPHVLNGASLANEIHQFTKFERRELNFDLDGAASAAQLLSDTAYRGNYTPEQLHPFSFTGLQ